MRPEPKTIMSEEAALEALVRSQTDGDGVFSKPPTRLVLAGVVLASLMAMAAIGAWITIISSLKTTQPLSITACTPDTFDARDELATQDHCVRPLTAKPSFWYTDEVIPVSGRVCIRVGPEVQVAYRLTVAAVPIVAGEGTRVLLLDVPITYNGGCQEPYSFPYEFPSFLYASQPEGASLGRWKIVGVATPVDQRTYDTYQWDVTSTAEVIVRHNNPGETE